MVYNTIDIIGEGGQAMKCTKCGRQTADGAVFCEKCLDVMKQYPIKAGTVIQLPQRKASSPKRAISRKKLLPPEEQVLQQKRTIRWLWLAWVCTFLLLCLSGVLLFRLSQTQETTATIGQNYSTRDASDRE